MHVARVAKQAYPLVFRLPTTIIHFGILQCSLQVLFQSLGLKLLNYFKFSIEMPTNLVNPAMAPLY